MLSVHTFTGIGAGAARATLRVEKNTESFIKNYIGLRLVGNSKAAKIP
jgi:hypothetical protein